MSNVVDLQFKYSESEYVRAARFYLQKTYHTRFNILIALLVTCAGVALWALESDSVLGYVFTFLGAILLLLHCRTYFLPQRWYARNPKLHDEYHIQFSDEGLLFRTKDIDSSIKWDFYRDVWETEQFYFLVYGKDAFSVIPKRAFKDEIEEHLFRQLLDRHITSVQRGRAALAAAKKDEPEEYVPKSLEPPDWR
ncbi:MAG TPA: YcxB family protein [Pyrinomonadaceae bacterium]